MNKFIEFVISVLSIATSGLLSSMVGKYLIYAVASRRGYFAVGGEYILLMIIFVVMAYGFNSIFTSVYEAIQETFNRH